MSSPTDQVSVGELIRLAFPPGTRTLAAAPRERLARAVQWVVLRAAGVTPRAGDFVLCDQMPAAAELAGWAAAGVVGAAAADDSAAEPDSEIPLAVLPAAADLRDVHQAALQLIVNRQAYLIECGARVYQTLARLSLDGAGLGGLARAMLDLTGKTVVVQDKRLQPLAHSITPGMSHVWPTLLEALSQGSQLPEGLRDRRQAAVGGWREQPLPGGLMRLVCPIVAKGIARGYLSLVSEAGQLDALDQLVIEHGAAACALEMSKAKAVSDVEKRARGDFVDALLTAVLPAEELSRWAQRIGYEQDVERPHAALVWRWGVDPAGGAPSARRLETLVNQAVAQEEVSALVRPYGAEVVAFCAVAEAGHPDEALALARALQKAALAEFPQTPLFGGVGRPGAELIHWKDSYREAAQALGMAARLAVSQPLYFGDLSVYRLLFQLEGSPELEGFCREVLGPLLDYEGGGDLLETLEAFCDRLGNLSQTAEKLFIHRNSLVYRMERIHQLAGLDLNNPDTRLAVHLALKVRKMLRPPSA